MSVSEPKIKKQKMYNHNNQQYKHRKKQFLEAGQRGFLATCNFRERDCVRECYNILNQYADELYGNEKMQEDSKNIAAENQEEIPDAREGSDDISDALKKEIHASKQDGKSTKARFQVVDTGTTNCLFIRTILPDPVELGVTIVKDIVKTREQKSRHLLRLLPIETVCHANPADIVKAAGQLFDKHFLKKATTFCIVFNKRYNNALHREDVISDLAALVSSKNVDNRVDLKGAKKTIIVEIVKGLCCLSVVEDYLLYKKYNLVELANFKGQIVTNEKALNVEKVDIKKMENLNEPVQKI